VRGVHFIHYKCLGIHLYGYFGTFVYFQNFLKTCHPPLLKCCAVNQQRSCQSVRTYSHATQRDEREGVRKMSVEAGVLCVLGLGRLGFRIYEGRDHDLGVTNTRGNWESF
jgi:hypothetical protein